MRNFEALDRTIEDLVQADAAWRWRLLPLADRPASPVTAAEEAELFRAREHAQRVYEDEVRRTFG